jgi:sugar O-acyltransferase (sialic acid O-acetyltransferase NeuD family)
MIIAGAGGHALELLDILISQGLDENLYFFDGINPISIFQDNYPVLNTMDQLKEKFQEDPRFILGVGNPTVRAKFFEDFTNAGGALFAVKGKGIAHSNFAVNNDADIFNLCFIGAKTVIGKGTLINTGAQIHHEVKIGEFSEINPGAILLGKAEVGDFCSIGANATILPKVKIGNHVTVGAGSVVTYDVPDGITVVGVPGKIIFKD